MDVDGHILGWVPGGIAQRAALQRPVQGMYGHELMGPVYIRGEAKGWPFVEAPLPYNAAEVRRAREIDVISLLDLLV